MRNVTWQEQPSAGQPRVNLVGPGSNERASGTPAPSAIPAPRTPDSDPDWSAALGPPASGEPDLLARIADEALLLRAWQELWESDSEDGYLAADVRKFGRHPIQQLANLRESLLTQAWRPGPVHEFSLDGTPESRVLRVSQAPDRVVERALAAVLAPILDEGLSPFSFGFRRGLGVSDAVTAVSDAANAGAKYVLRADIAHAFDEVPRAAIVGTLAARIADARLVGMVAMLLERLDSAGGEGVGIPQGSSVSPLLLNLYLDRLDRRLLELGFLPIHYADDYAIPVADADEGLTLVDHFAAGLADLGLRLNDRKTDIVAFADGVEYLGQRLHGVGDPSLHPGVAHPRRISTFVTGPALCRLSAGRLRVDRAGETVRAISLSRVKQLVVSGRVGLTTPLITEAARQGTEIVLVNDYGGFIARLSRRRGGDIRIKQAQFRYADDPAEALALARTFVAGKIANMRVGVLRSLRHDVSQPGASRVAGSLEAAAGWALEAENPAALMGIEGSAARVYFQWVADNVEASWQFSGRNRRPPRDPINAMLSFGYTLLAAEIVAACEIAHLDPDLGFLHSPRWGRPALALDLMEQWRPVLVDQLVLHLVTRKVVHPDQFVADHQQGTRMLPAAKTALLAAYEHRLLSLASHDAAKGKRAYRELLAIDAAQLGQALLTGKPGEYRGYRWR